MLAVGFLSSALAADWGYPYNPEKWGGTCASGKSQSPIDLPKYEGGDRADLDLNWSNPLHLDATHKHSLQWGTDDDANTITWPPAGTGYVGGKEFTFLQVHCHTGSENFVEGKQYDGECHFVHADEDSNLLVVGLFLEVPGEHEYLTKMLEPIPDDDSWDKQSLAGTWDITKIIEDVDTSRYWTYSGSLTTPPCSENVQWIVLQDVKKVSRDQIEKIKTASGFPSNFRPPNPLNGREVGGAESPGGGGNGLGMGLLGGATGLLFLGLLVGCCCYCKKRHDNADSGSLEQQAFTSPQAQGQEGVASPKLDASGYSAVPMQQPGFQLGQAGGNVAMQSMPPCDSYC